TTTGTYNSGNVFTVQLSDLTGSFSNPVSIGTKTATTTGTFTIPFTIPAGTTPGTTYQINVVSSNPAITGSSSTSFTITNSCVLSYCPSITGIVTDGCDGVAAPCEEGQSEVVFVNTGSYSVTVSAFNTSNIINYYGNVTNFNANKPDSYTGNMVPASAGMVSTLNTSTTTCSGVFTVPSGTLAPGSVIMMVACDFCSSHYDFSHICAGFSKIYVMTYVTPRCGTGGQWNISGNFGNHNGGAGTNPKYITADFTGVTTPSSTCGAEYYTYYAGTETNGNGASVAYNGISTNMASPTNPSTYTPTGCSLPVVLPIQLLSFTATKTQQNITLNWATINQVNNNYFEAEYSIDTQNFIPFYQTKGAGNSNEVIEYSCPFNVNIGDNTPYFRLKQVDYNGNYKYSNIVSLSSTVGLSSVNIYYNTIKDKIVTKFKLDAPTQVSISLYDITGREVYSSTSQFNEGDNQFLITSPDVSGVYILVYQNGSAAPVHKKVMVTK
ncbi:MAG TPA: T9SS type A sorting domain-containing protein, partial [Bacteroidia bacterium]